MSCPYASLLFRSKAKNNTLIFYTNRLNECYYSKQHYFRIKQEATWLDDRGVPSQIPVSIDHLLICAIEV